MSERPACGMPWSKHRSAATGRGAGRAPPLSSSVEQAIDNLHDQAGRDGRQQYIVVDAHPIMAMRRRTQAIPPVVLNVIVRNPISGREPLANVPDVMLVAMGRMVCATVIPHLVLHVRPLVIVAVLGPAAAIVAMMMAAVGMRDRHQPTQQRHGDDTR